MTSQPIVPSALGESAFHDGKLLEMNPYSPDDEAHAQWESGWVAARNKAAEGGEGNEEVIPGTLPLGSDGYAEFVGRALDGAPKELVKWAREMKGPLVVSSPLTVLAAAQHVVSMTTRGRQRELQKSMTPEAIAAAMSLNTEVIAKFADQRALESALIVSMQRQLTSAALEFLLMLAVG